MAKLKLKYNNSIYSVTDDSVRDGEIAAINEYGAKNLLLNAATTQEVRGITFTIYGDGSVKANGTASANIWFILTVNDTSVNLPLEQGKDYILSGCPSEGSDDNYYLYVEQYYDGEYHTNKDYGNGVQFKGHSRIKDAVVIYVKSGTVMSNLMFYPMIRDSRITDSTYVPYSMTNRELTPSTSSSNGLTLIRIGNVRLLHFEGVANLITGQAIAEEDRPRSNVTGMAIVNDMNGQYHRMGALSIHAANGAIEAYAALNYDVAATMDEVSSSSSTWIYGDMAWFV